MLRDALMMGSVTGRAFLFRWALPYRRTATRALRAPVAPALGLSWIRHGSGDPVGLQAAPFFLLLGRG